MTAPQSVYITGSTGFVGSNLCTYLRQKGFAITNGKVRYGHAIPSIMADGVVHLSGKAHDLRNVSSDTDYLEANHLLTRQLFDKFLDSEATVFVFVSSVKAAADSIKGILTEATPAMPRTIYGKSKLLAEQYLTAHLPYGKRVYILRPCMIHGPGNKGNLNLLYQFAAKGIPWPLGAFNNKRSFCSITNFCFAVNELLQNRSIPSGTYNVADDDPLSTNEIISMIGDSLGYKSRIWRVPGSIINRVAKTGDLLHLPLNTERLQKLTEDYVVSNAKLKAALGKPLPLSAQEGMLQTFQSFRSDAQ